MKPEILILFFGLFLQTTFVYAQNQTSYNQQLHEINILPSNWENYTYKEKNILIEQIKTRIRQIDNNISFIQSGNDSAFIKKERIEVRKQQKERLKEVIKRIETSKENEWNSIRNEAIELYNKSKMEY